MIRTRFVPVIAAAVFSISCAGSFQGSASVSVEAEIDVPIAQMPPKYASWVVEAEGYLAAVNESHARFLIARAELAAALGVDAQGDAIARFIRSAIQVETRLICEPPRFEANLVAQCTAKASARAAGSAGPGAASGYASAGIKANCQANASLSLSPGSCRLETTVTEHPILSDAARWAKVEANMKIILQLAAANEHLDGRGEGINARGLELYVQSVTDLATDPTLALRLNQIQAELKKGADATGEANNKQSEMNVELAHMTGAIDAQFPQLRASIAMR